LVGQNELNQDFILIDEEKDARRGSYSHFLKAAIFNCDLGKIKAPLSREFF